MKILSLAVYFAIGFVFLTPKSMACPSLDGMYRGNWVRPDGSIYVTSTITIRQTGCDSLSYREFFGEGDVSLIEYKLGEVTYESGGPDSTNAVTAFYQGDQLVISGISFNTKTKSLNTLQNVFYRIAVDGSLVAEEVSVRDLPSIKGQSKLTFRGQRINP